MFGKLERYQRGTIIIFAGFLFGIFLDNFSLYPKSNGNFIAVPCAGDIKMRAAMNARAEWGIGQESSSFQVLPFFNNSRCFPRLLLAALLDNLSLYPTSNGIFIQVPGARCIIEDNRASAKNRRRWRFFGARLDRSADPIPRETPLNRN